MSFMQSFMDEFVHELLYRAPTEGIIEEDLDDFTEQFYESWNKWSRENI